jgi:hypothetical protein
MYLVIEFIPAHDEKVKQLLENKSLLVEHYNQTLFESLFSSSFQIIKKQQVPQSERTLYLMRKNVTAHESHA